MRNIKLTIITFLIAFPFQATSQVAEVCIDNFNYFKCTKYLSKEIDKESSKVDYDDINKIYNVIKNISMGRFKGVEAESSGEIYSLSLLMDDYINKSVHFISGVKEISVIDEEGNYIVDGINDRMDIYFNIIGNYPYSKYSPSAVIGVNHYSIILCNIDQDNCDTYLKQALYHIKLLTERGEESLLDKSFTAWRWYNDALLKQYVTNLYLGNYDENVEIRNKIKNYKQVVNEFGVRYTSSGVVPSDYIDQVYINLVTPTHETRLKKYFSNDVIANKLLTFESLINPKMDPRVAVDIYHDLMVDIENNDYFILLKSTESQFKAELMVEEVNSLSIKEEDINMKLILEKVKVVPPSLGSYWGTGVGPLKHKDVELFKANSERLGIEDFYIMRQRVLPE